MQKALENVKIGPGRLSKVAGAALPAFQKRIVESEKYLAVFKIVKLALAVFEKLSAQLPEICHPIGALAGFVKLFANSIAFHAKGLRIY